MCSNGWDDVTAALQLLSHLHGDALNVALLVPESRRVKPGFLIKSLSEHYNAPGRLAKYKRQFQWAFRRPGDDLSVFATELETLARRAFIDIDLKIQLQMVRDRFIDGQAERALRRHLDSLGLNTPMTDIVDCCRMWQRHCEVEIQPRTSANRRPECVICQVTGTVEDVIKKLLPTFGPGPPHPTTDASDMPTNAGGTGAIAGDRLGKIVTELASSWNSHGGGRCFARPIIRIRRRVLFVREIGPYDGPMPDFG